MTPALPTHRRLRTRRQGRQKHDIQPHCTKRAKQRDSSKNPCPQIPGPGLLHTPAPDMQRLGNGEGRVRGLEPRAWGAYRRRGQAGPPDGLGAGVQRWVLVLREGGMHGKVRLLAVHGHHLDGLACKSTNTPKVRGKVRTPALPASLPRLQPPQLAARKRRPRGGLLRSCCRRCRPALALTAQSAAHRPRDPSSPRALAPRADGMHSSYT